MGVVNFGKYTLLLVNTYIDVTNANDLVLSLGLYVIYPAILYLLIDKFHGVCGPQTYLKKAEAIAACNTVFLWFSTLLRTSKLIQIMIYSVDADYKSGSQRDLEILDSETEDEGRKVQPSPTSGGATGGLLGKLKCQTWMHLTQELSLVGFVSFLLIICLPVLAFWVMFISSLVSCCGIYSSMKRIWKDAHESTGGSAGLVGGEEEGGDVEFEEFLSNFGEDGK